MEALSSSNELFNNFVIYETISATPFSQSLNPNNTTTTFLFNNNNDNDVNHHDQFFLDHLFQTDGRDSSSMIVKRKETETRSVGPTISSVVGNCNKKKKRKRKARVCKNKEEAETQRMTHIAVERNRRKQMNEHLAVLRSIMPDSYVQRGDQASIVGGAIEFVKQLEHLLQSLEAQKLQSNQQGTSTNNINNSNDNYISSNTNHNNKDHAILESYKSLERPFSQFFAYPQYTWSQPSNKYTLSKSKAAMADIEVTLIETHASLRILSRRSLRQLSKLVAGLQKLRLTVLHLNVTTMSSLVLYSVSVKVEEECLLTSVDDIASAVHQMLGIIEDEAVSNLCVEYEKLN